MTPEVENVLDGIGWGVIKRASPLFAAQLGSAFSDASMAYTDVHARRQAKEIERLFRASHHLAKDLRALPESVQRNIFIASVHPDELVSLKTDPRCNPLMQEVETTLLRLMKGLEATQARLDYEGGKPRRGPPKNLKPYSVAYATAQIYFIGRGEWPSAHNATAGNEIAGLFGQTVEALFGVMGLGLDAIGPARAAILKLDGLSDEELEDMLLLRCPLTRSDMTVGFKKLF